MNYATCSHYCHCFQVLHDVGITDHLWQIQLDEIATTVENLGYDIHPAIHNGWLACFKKVYPAGPAAANPAIRQKALAINDTELAGAIPP
jgi:hypothetical protein